MKEIAESLGESRQNISNIHKKRARQSQKATGQAKKGGK